jgi:hypothetical protein
MVLGTSVSIGSVAKWAGSWLIGSVKLAWRVPHV